MIGKPLKVELSSMLKQPPSQSPSVATSFDTNSFLAQYNQLLLCQNEQTLRRKHLLSIVGSPPGLTSESQQGCLQLPMNIIVKDTCDQSTTCSSSPRVSHDGNDILDASSLEMQTTLIIRNLVGHCTRQMLLDFMDRHGFQSKYDLLYLPRRFIGKKCFHYAFVNFVTERAAVEFQAQLHGCDEADLFGESAAEISWSQCQGLETNIAKFRNSSVMHPAVNDECRPLLFADGKAIPFPKPNRRIKQDRRTLQAVDDCIGA